MNIVLDDENKSNFGEKYVDIFLVPCIVNNK